MKVLIAGAGIGGLTLAACLQKAGIDYQIFERAPRFLLLGAGLLVQPNAIRALEQFGLDGPVRKAGLVPQATDIRDWKGGLLSEMHMTELAAELGAPTVNIHRGRLHEALFQQTDPSKTTMGKTVTGYRTDASGVDLLFEDGSQVHGELVVAADGARSAIRRQMLDDGDPIYAGYTSFRGIAQEVADVDPSRIVESWGSGKRFGIVPIGPNLTYWFATANHEPGEEISGEAAKARVQELFAGWHAPIPGLVEATPADELIHIDIADRPTITRWTDGNVVLLGDAAHPMTPNLGQGGCQAIEDAVVLTLALQSERSMTAALELYMKKRVERANSIVHTSKRYGALGQWESSVARWFRDFSMHHTPEGMVKSQLKQVLTFTG